MLFQAATTSCRSWSPKHNHPEATMMGRPLSLPGDGLCARGGGDAQPAPSSAGGSQPCGPPQPGSPTSRGRGEVLRTYLNAFLHYHETHK